MKIKRNIPVRVCASQEVTSSDARHVVAGDRDASSSEAASLPPTSQMVVINLKKFDELLDD